MTLTGPVEARPQQGSFLGTVKLEVKQVNYSTCVTYLVAHQEEVLSQQKVFQHIFHHHHVLQGDFNRNMSKSSEDLINFIDLAQCALHFTYYESSTV